MIKLKFHIFPVTTCLAIVAALIGCSTANCTGYDENICVGRTGGVFIRSPQSCQRWVQCHEEAIFNCGTCLDGFFFDPVRGGCAQAHTVDCNVGALSCSAPGNRRVPHPESCSIYFQCYGNGNYIEHRCREDLHFDATEEQCDLIDNVRCLREPITIECPDPLKAITLEPHPFLCTNFFMCIHGTPHEEVCLEGMIFDHNLRRCQQIALAYCPDWETETDPDIDVA